MITYMNTLPDSPQVAGTNNAHQPSTGDASGQAVHSPSLTGKEKEVSGVGGLEESALREVGREAELPPEVTGAGVRMQRTATPLPSSVQRLGVRQVGAGAPPPAPAAVALPLSDDQIVQGLHQSITSSWRWLAQWCIRRLKQLHLIVKSVHGNIVRVKS